MQVATQSRVPGMWWSISGHLYPNVPMYGVRDVAVVHIENRNGELHLHGHHVVVLARNGVAATGSPSWVDSLNVSANETDIAFVANTDLSARVVAMATTDADKSVLGS